TGKRDAEEGGGLGEGPEGRQDAAAHQLGDLGLSLRAAHVDAVTPRQAFRIDRPGPPVAEGAEGEVGSAARGHLARPTGHGVAPQTSADRSGPAAAGSLPPRVLAGTPWTTERTRSSRGCGQRTSASSG